MQALKLGDLRNVGPATLQDFQRLGVSSVSALAVQSADDLYVRLCQITGQRQDPCVHDVFSAAIHQAQTGIAMAWWAFTAKRKSRQAAGRFPAV